MRKIVIICDRCKKDIEGEIFGVTLENVDTEGTLKVADKFNVCGMDLCESCAEEIAEFIKSCTGATKERRTKEQKNKNEDKDTEKVDFKKLIEEVSGVKVSGRKTIDKEKAVKMKKEGKTNSEIAEEFGVEPASVSSLFSRLRKSGSISVY